MIRKLSLNVLKFSFHLDHTVLTTMKLIYAKHQTKILGILNLNILLPLLHPRWMVVLVGERIAIICTFLVPGYQGVFTCIISVNCDKWRQHTPGTINSTIRTLNLFTKVHVEIQEQLLKSDTLDHLSFEIKTLDTVSCMCHIHI